MDGYIYRIASSTNIIGRPPVFTSSDNLRKVGATFASVYAVTAGDASFIEQAGTAAGFRGTVWSQRLWVDIDTEEASTAAQKSLRELGYDHVIYTTGNRGCHIGILRDTKPSHVLPAQDKAWVQANIPGADLSLYWHLHLIRLPGTKHEKTGLPKRLIYRQEGKALTLPPYEPKEAGGNTDTSLRGVSPQRPSIFKTWEVMQHLTPTGHRRQLVLLALALARDAKVSYDEALWVVRELNRGYDAPKDDSALIRILDWVYGKD